MTDQPSKLHAAHTSIVRCCVSHRMWIGPRSASAQIEGCASLRVRRRRSERCYRGLGGGGLGTPVVSYAPRPKFMGCSVGVRIMVSDLM